MTLLALVSAALAVEIELQVEPRELEVGQTVEVDLKVTDGNVRGPPDVPVDVPVDTGVCGTAADCDDRVFCNGAERCMPGSAGADARGCIAAAAPACDAATQVCNEGTRMCTPRPCTTPDRDGDGHNDVACGGDDCDDNDRLRHKNAE